MIEILDVCKTYGTGNRALRNINITGPVNPLSCAC